MWSGEEQKAKKQQLLTLDLGSSCYIVLLVKSSSCLVGKEQVATAELLTAPDSTGILSATVSLLSVEMQIVLASAL